MQDGVDGALGRDTNIAGQAPHQELPNLARAPVRLYLLERDDLVFDLWRQLVGVAHWAPRPISQRFKALILIAGEDLVTGLARNAEFPADLRHRFAVQQPGHEPQTLIHHRTL